MRFMCFCHYCVITQITKLEMYSCNSMIVSHYFVNRASVVRTLALGWRPLHLRSDPFRRTPAPLGARRRRSKKSKSVSAEPVPEIQEDVESPPIVELESQEGIPEAASVPEGETEVQEVLPEAKAQSFEIVESIPSDEIGLVKVESESVFDWTPYGVAAALLAAAIVGAVFVGRSFRPLTVNNRHILAKLRTVRNLIFHLLTFI